MGVVHESGNKQPTGSGNAEPEVVLSLWQEFYPKPLGHYCQVKKITAFTFSRCDVHTMVYGTRIPVPYIYNYTVTVLVPYNF